jgi:hypothetical protein
MSLRYVKKAEAKAQAIYLARSEMEKARAIPFEHLASAASAGTTITPIADDLYLIRVGDLNTLRSKYQ